MRLRLQNLQRIYKQMIMLCTDVFLLIIAFYFSFILRGAEHYIVKSWWLFLALPVVMIPVFVRLGMYRAVLQYLGVKIITTTFKATTLSCIVIGFFLMFFREYDHLPRTVLIIFWFVSNFLIIFSRFLSKGLLYSWDSFVDERKATIIYGAGDAGVQLLESLKNSTTYSPVAFIDDSKERHGTILNYLEVFPFTKLEYLIKKKDARVLLLAIPSATQKLKTSILKKLTKYPIEVKILPAVDRLVNGMVSIDNIKHVEVGDILGRIPVSPKEELLARNITNKNVLVTGAGGSIGSELSRQIIKLKPNNLIVLDNSEFNLYRIHLELISLGVNTNIIPALCTVTNYYQLKKLIIQHQIHTIYHAAAYKHVPMVETNIVSGVYNNVVGTYNVAKIAHDFNVENMVLISTDKAVRPTNIMGASKRLSELVLQALAEKSKCCFSMVRFGNVLDSAGSVVPLFRKQISEGGPVTVTHRNITRYFMSIPEASQLVLQAGAMAKGGDVFVLDMGEPIKIIDLAYKMIHLSGLTPIDHENPDGDIRIEYTGLRPGEKLFEELLIGNDVIQSEHPRIMQAIEKKLDFNTVLSCIETIKEAREQQDEKIVKNLLLKYVDGYTSDIL